MARLPPKGARLLRLVFVAAAAVFAFVVVCVASLRFINPPLTGVQIERWLESWGTEPDYVMRRTYVPLARISPHLQHAVIAAEDGRFYDHHGIDWIEVRKVLTAGARRGRLGRGASTITQQVVKNVFLTTDRTFLRKAAEIPLALLAELLLPKQRILELYLNIAEWGPGVFGAEAAARYHYGITSAALSRDQAARLAACLPAPQRRRPARMNGYSGIILGRMRAMGW
jgi:monofunctional biosynthetic peptidoglycan transglycosylase